jgi:hypothetical protein
MSVGFDEQSKAITRVPVRRVRTGVVSREAFVTPSPHQSERVAAFYEWQAFVKLLELWTLSAGKIDEDGLQDPSMDAIEAASEIISRSQERGVKPATRLVDDGDGGLAMKWIEGESMTSIAIDQDGAVELLKFEGNRLVLQAPVPSTAIWR